MFVNTKFFLRVIRTHLKSIKSGSTQYVSLAPAILQAEEAINPLIYTLITKTLMRNKDNDVFFKVSHKHDAMYIIYNATAQYTSMKHCNYSILAGI